MRKLKLIELRERCAKCAHIHIALACPTVPPDPESDEVVDNEKRAAWGLEAVETYARRTGLDISPDADGVETAISDLLADLQHVADREGLDFGDMVHRAGMHYAAETALPGCDACGHPLNDAFGKSLGCEDCEAEFCSATCQKAHECEGKATA